jgi:hypothetical protein
MRIDRRWVLAGAMLTILPLIFTVLARGDRDETKMRWDLISVDFNTLTLSAGGTASAFADDGSKITLTGSGTFKPDDLEEVTGGGNWTTHDSKGAITGNGTYEVKRLVKFDVAPGTFPLKIDAIGNPLDVRAGLVFLRIRYSPGGQSGILVVSCNTSVGTPDNVFEGITASKGNVDYWKRELAPAPPGNTDRTVFHVVPEAED